MRRQCGLTTNDFDYFLVLLSSSLLLFLVVSCLLGDQQDVAAKDLLSEAWSAYWAVTSRRSAETAVMYVIVTLLLTACPAACVYYSVRCTRLINLLNQYTHSLNIQTQVNSAICGFGFSILLDCTRCHRKPATGHRESTRYVVFHKVV